MSKAKVDPKKLMSMINQYTPREVNFIDGAVSSPRWETGIIAFDTLLGGGIPHNTMVGFASEKGGGKSTTMVQAGMNIIDKYGKKIFYFDVEGGVTPELIESMGFSHHLYHPVHNKDGKFYILRATFLQQIVEVYGEILKDPDAALMILDSTTQAADQRMAESPTMGLDKNFVGAHARMWSEASRVMNAMLIDSQAQISVILIHQVRENLSNFIVQTQASRGNALAHVVGVDILGKIGKYLDKDGKETKRNGAAGVTLRLTTTKNRLTSPFQQVEMPLFFGRGVSNLWEFRNFMENFDVEKPETGEIVKMVYRSGSWFYINFPGEPEVKFQGGDGVLDYINEHALKIKEFIDNNGGFIVDSIDMGLE